MKKFIKKEWFKIIIIILLSIITISYASSKYVYYQKQQIQLWEIQRKQKAKEDMYPMFLKIREADDSGNDEEAMKLLNGLTEEEYRIYRLLLK